MLAESSYKHIHHGNFRNVPPFSERNLVFFEFEIRHRRIPPKTWEGGGIIRKQIVQYNNNASCGGNFSKIRRPTKLAFNFPFVPRLAIILPAETGNRKRSFITFAGKIPAAVQTIIIIRSCLLSRGSLRSKVAQLLTRNRLIVEFRRATASERFAN